MTKDWEETDYAPSEIELASPAPGGLTAAQFEVLTKESAIKAKNLTMSSRTTRADMSW